MASRNKNRKNSTNTNENRIRRTSKDDLRAGSKRRIKAQQKRDKTVKLIVSALTLAIVIGLGYFNIQKRSELTAKRTEYNKLISDVISTELKRDRLEAKLENSVDLNRIQRYALEELGMVYANNDNTNLEASGN